MSGADASELPAPWGRLAAAALGESDERDAGGGAEGKPDVV